LNSWLVDIIVYILSTHEIPLLFNDEKLLLLYRLTNFTFFFKKKYLTLNIYCISSNIKSKFFLKKYSKISWLLKDKSTPPLIISINAPKNKLKIDEDNVPSTCGINCNHVNLFFFFFARSKMHLDGSNIIIY